MVKKNADLCEDSLEFLHFPYKYFLEKIKIPNFGTCYWSCFMPNFVLVYNLKECKKMKRYLHPNEVSALNLTCCHYWLNNNDAKI